MEKELLYEDQNLKLEFVPQGKYIHETWWGVTGPEVFRRQLDIIVKELIQKGVKKLLLDTREHKGLGLDSQALAAERIGNYAKEYGPFFQAIIIPKDVFSRFSVENFVKKLDTKNEIITQYFDNVRAAEKWLSEENK